MDTTLDIPRFEEKMNAARLALRGTALGDSFGQSFLFQRDAPTVALRQRSLPPAVWRWSGDTMMASAIVSVLAGAGRIDQDALAHEFATRFVEQPERGYGAVAHYILNEISKGVFWRTAAGGVYGGTGSMGNGAAMRAAPIGGSFSDEIEVAAREAIASAGVTHMHPDGIAGAVAIAVASALVKQHADRGTAWNATTLFSTVIDQLAPSAVRDGVRQASKLGSTEPETAARQLGDGSRVTALDTVPYALWCLAYAEGSFDERLFFSMRGLLEPGADCDTVCAIVGGMTALTLGESALPSSWLKRVETLPSHARSSFLSPTNS